jgi:hydrogenase maturation factor
VLVHAALGEDAAAVAIGDEALVLTSDPITGAAERAGWYAVHVNCNDVAAMGAAPIGVLVTLLLPEGAEETAVESVMADVDRAARELGIEVLGGHTEVAPGLQAPLISMTAVGRARRDLGVTAEHLDPELAGGAVNVGYQRGDVVLLD